MNETDGILPVLTLEQFRSILTAPCAVIFIYVGWSIQARRSRAVATEVATNCRDGEPPVTFCSIDLSDQEGPMWEFVREWLTAHSYPTDQLTYGGYGPLVWTRYAKAIDCVWSAELHKATDLIERTINIASKEEE
jgi:hypothetical protein